MKKIITSILLILSITINAQVKDVRSFTLGTANLLDSFPCLNSGDKLVTAKSISELSYITTTYTALKSIKENNLLSKGKYYLISDYQTIYIQPDYDAGGNLKATLNLKTEAVEPLLVLATSDSTLSENAYSLTFPKDKLKYNIDDSLTFTYGGSVTAQPTKGRIYERIDERNNRTDYDHRTVKFKRYEDAVGSGIYSTLNDNTNSSQEYLTFSNSSFNNYINGLYLIRDNIGIEFSNICINISENSTFLGYIYNSTFLGYIANSTFLGDIYYSTFLGDIYSSTFSGNINYSTFSGEISSATFSGQIINSNMLNQNNPLSFVTTQIYINNKTIDEADPTYGTLLFGANFNKELVSDQSTGDIYLKYYTPSLATKENYILIP